ncbi:probable serine/threonine-protein kinase PIX13 isoform X2 [Mangifera indica]|uniref:probable serine/threonine-protein kinase PIX13 isoform X2 n=1 Tax=Mangifera indica TaxID=29780 RepID=UPI001CFB70E1|nr:probable serine/threonine-protein kinase PIX13 isoform X2 [Mangifera indica]
MGNCWVSCSKEANPTTPNTTSIHNPTSSGVSNIYSHTTEISATSSQAVNEGGEEATADGQILETPNLKMFIFADLKLATKNFKSDTLLGEGTFGKVYKGWIDEKTFAPSKSGIGMVVAIKKFRSEIMLQEWQSEVNFLGRLSHPNLVKLLGYCREDKGLLLVYEFMQMRSLDKQLFRRDPSIEPLSWDIRIKIAIGVARGLAFLHTSENKILNWFEMLIDSHGWHRGKPIPMVKKVIHIERFHAKLGHFGLAKWGPAGAESHVTTMVMGTYGYAAPEYITTGHLYVKSDVYSFGVVLLELLTGLRVLDRERPREEENLVCWMKPMLSQKTKLKDIMDARMEGQYSIEAAKRATQLALKCLKLDPRHRPSMKEVVEILERVEAMK